MSEALEEIFTAFSCNQVPKLWASKGFLSTKSLSYWVIDFQYRIDFIQVIKNFIRNGTYRFDNGYTEKHKFLPVNLFFLTNNGCAERGGGGFLTNNGFIETLPELEPKLTGV